MMIRKPVVAGQFYPGVKAALGKMVESLMSPPAKKIDAIGVVSPHAGYIYSGPVAGAVLGSIKPKAHYVILGPNHTGLGEAFSISKADAWNTPLGDVKIDKKLADAIRKAAPFIKEDDLAHSSEHSIEVQLPFLQSLGNTFEFVPIVISHADLEVYKETGKALAKAIRVLGLEKDVAIIASSDMTHYEEHETAKAKDSKAIEAMIRLDEDELFNRVEDLDITMCGYAPAVIMITAAKALGAKDARLIRYETSGEASGDFSSVVGYAGIVVN